MRRLAALWLVAALGCEQARTEVVVVVDTVGLTVPRDLDALHLTVTSGGATRFDSSAIPLCRGAGSSGCYGLPVTLTLLPGDERPDDPVRVEVQALLGTQVVIDDAVVFTFVKGVSSRLDITLFASCLGADCAASDRVCGRDGQCTTLTPQPFAGEPDLAMTATRSDAGAAADLASPDLALADLSLPDLATDDLAPIGCGAASTGATHYVDPVFGTDDGQHGGAAGACAYKTITYALGNATGTISLANATYQAAETFPLQLGAATNLVCNGATLRGFGGTNHDTLELTGGNHQLTDCIVDCSVSAIAQCIVMVGGTLQMSGGELVGAGGTGLSSTGSVTLSNVFVHGFTDAVFVQGAGPATYSNNTFANNNIDLECDMAAPAITGSGNTRSDKALACTLCQNCPFL